IDNHVISAWFALDHPVDFDEFRGDIFPTGFLIHPLNKRWRKAVFLAKKNSDFFHSFATVGSSEAGTKSRYLWKLQTLAREVSTSLDVINRESSWRTLMKPGLSRLLRETHNQAVLMTLSRTRV